MTCVLFGLVCIGCETQTNTVQAQIFIEGYVQLVFTYVMVVCSINVLYNVMKINNSVKRFQKKKNST